MRLFYLITVLLICLTACRQEKVYQPKPKGYFRLETPTAEYQNFDSLFPFKFEFSKHAQLQTKNETYWFDLIYPDFGATVYFTYFALPHPDSLARFAYQSTKFAEKHIIKADDIPISTISDPEEKIYGLIYEIEGSDVACPYQFWITDSAKHFLRASLYFNSVPNNDSLAPVIEYVKNDLLHLINTFQWKK